MTGFPPPLPGWRQYTPRPKVVAAFLSALLVIVLLVLARVAGVDVNEWVQMILVAVGSGVGGYVKSE